MRKNSIKNVRINAEVQRALGELIRMGIKDPRVSSLTSVTDVEVAPDLKTAKVYISVLGDEKKQKDTLDGLKSAMPYLRRELARSINLRNTPELRFHLDTSIEYGVRMAEIMNKINSDNEDGTEADIAEETGEE